jgi:hypothetical protein
VGNRNPGNRDFNSERNYSNRVNQGNRANQGNRVNQGNRDFNSERNYSNRVNKSGNRVNAGNTININNKRAIVNPANPGGAAWGWHGGRPWYPSSGYWGGGFWGGIAIGAVTGAIVGAAAANSQPDYVVIQQGSPGYTLLSGYGLTQTRCGGSVVVINGPSDSVICAYPTPEFPAGVYTVDAASLTIIRQ